LRRSPAETADRIEAALAALEGALSRTDARLTDLSAIAVLIRMIRTLSPADPERLRGALLSARDELGGQVEEVHQSVAMASASAMEWDRRAGLAGAEGRSDLALQAHARAEEYRLTRAALDLEETYLGAALARCEDALSALDGPT
jgi:hypothetical protein